jgi:hypothetical protein
MLTTLELENYRGFPRYRLQDLARVNLLVGKNNCGKTSLLEAVHLLVSGGDPGVLTSTAWQRGEVAFAGRTLDRKAQETCPVLTHFFHGHEFRAGVSFIVRTGGAIGEMIVRVVEIDDLPRVERERLFPKPRLKGFFEPWTLRNELAVRIERPGTQQEHSNAFVVTADGAVLPGAFSGSSGIHEDVGDGARRVYFVTPDYSEPRSVTEMWDRVIAEGREGEVVETMRILEPNLRGIFFLSGHESPRSGRRGGILAEFAHGGRRTPLGTHGGGMHRLLKLSLSLVRSEGGVLLVDEIDTGLHYSIMGDMWRLVTEAARRSGVQVFATTHSSDCVRGLAWLCENHPELADEVSLQKIDCDVEQAVALKAEQLVLAVNQGMEVR